MRKIVIMGASIHTGNLGVSALSHSLMTIISSIDEDVEFNLLIPHRKEEITSLKLNDKLYNVQTKNYRLSPFSKLKENYLVILILALFRKFLIFNSLKERLDRKIPIFSLIRNADIIGDVWGGDSFSDIYGLPVYIKEVLIRNVVLSMRNDFIIFPQTFGPYKKYFSLFLAKKIFKKSSVVLARGVEDISLLKNTQGLKEINISFCPDVAFMLNASVFSKLKIDDKIFLENKELIGINISGLMLSNKGKYGMKVEYKELIIQIIDFFVKDQKMSVILIPHTYSYPNPLSQDDDYLSCQKIYNNLSNEIQGSVRCLFYNLSPEEIKWIIGKCSFFIGSRMHSTIASISQKIPTVGISYSKKFKEVFSTADISDCVIDGCSATNEESLSLIKTLFFKRDELSHRLNESIPKIIELVKISFQKIIQ